MKKKTKIEKKDLEELLHAATSSIHAVVVELVKTKKEKESAKLLGTLVAEMKKIIQVAEHYSDNGALH